MHQQHLMLMSQEYAAIEAYKHDGKSPRHAALLVRPDLRGKEFLQRGIHITLYGDLPDCQDDELAPIATDMPMQGAVVLAEETPAETLPFAEIAAVASEPVVIRYANGIRICNAPGCEKAHKGRGLCETHYSQVYKRKSVTYEALMALAVDN